MTLNNGVLTVNSQSNLEVKTYNMRVTMTTPNSGDQTFDTVKVVLDVCVITSLAKPSAPQTTTYKIFDKPALTIDLSNPGFQQVPACGYYLVETFTWTIPQGAPITQNNSGNSKYKIDTLSTDPTKHGTYTVKLALSALYATLVATFTQEIEFVVTVNDPCRTTTIAAFTLQQMTIQAGQTKTQDYTQPLISAGTAVNDQTICGAFTYTVYKIGAGDTNVAQTLITSAKVAGTQQRLTATTQKESDIGLHQMRLVVSLGRNEYPTLSVTFSLLI